MQIYQFGVGVATPDRMRVARIAAILLTSAAPIAWAVLGNSARTLRDLILSGDRSADETVLWYLFRPADCGERSSVFDTLNALHARAGVSVHGVMLEGPADTAIARQLVGQFGARFPVSFDTKGVWAQAIHTEAKQAPLFVTHAAGETMTVADARGPGGTAILKALIGDSSIRATRRPPGHMPSARKFLRSPIRIVAGKDGFNGLSRAEILRATADRIYAFDFDSMAVRAFDHAGRALWTRSQPASGSSFANPTDLRIHSKKLELLDPDLRTLWTFDLTGEATARVRLARTIHRFVRRHDGALVGFLPSGSDNLAVLFDSSGAFIRDLPGPSSVQQLFPLLREASVTTLPGADSVAVVFRWSGKLLVFDPTLGPAELLDMVEPIPFPRILSWKHPDGATSVRVDPNAIESAVDVDADQDFIYVLFGGATTEGRAEQIDVYRRNGVYVGTYRFPAPIVAMARVPGGFLTVSRRNNSHQLERWKAQQ